MNVREMVEQIKAKWQRPQFSSHLGKVETKASSYFVTYLRLDGGFTVKGLVIDFQTPFGDIPSIRCLS